MYQATSIQVASGGTNAVGAFNFSLSQLPAPTEFTSLYDSYKITGAKVIMVPRSSEVENQATIPTTFGVGQFFYYRDDNDANPPSSLLSDVLQVQGIRWKRPLNIFSLYIKNPKFSYDVFSGSTDTYAAQKTGWISTAVTTVQHYGYKWLWTQPSSANEAMDVYIKLYMKFRGVQ